MGLCEVIWGKVETLPRQHNTDMASLAFQLLSLNAVFFPLPGLGAQMLSVTHSDSALDDTDSVTILVTVGSVMCPVGLVLTWDHGRSGGDSVCVERQLCGVGYYSNLLRYNLHRVKCTNLKCTTRGFFTYLHICDHHLDKDMGHFHHLRSSYCPSPKGTTLQTSINMD